jgi:MscS family membrane protein
LLVKIREMLVGHPRIHPDPARARFTGFGASSLDIEVYAYAMTRDWAEFLGIQEDVLLRVMDIVEQSGTGFAFPSQTLYFARDGGLDAERTVCRSQVRQWRGEAACRSPISRRSNCRRCGRRSFIRHQAPGQAVPEERVIRRRIRQSAGSPQTKPEKEPSREC